MKILRSGQHGFTLVEVLIVVAVLAVLAAIVTPAVSGVVTSARTQGKEGDIKNVETGVQRYGADNNSALPITGTEPTESVADTNDDGTIVVQVGAPTDLGGAVVDVTCTTLAACFGALDFAGKLVPEYVKAAPKHATDPVTVPLLAGADLTITGGDSSGNTIAFYLETAITSGLQVWNVDGDGKIIVLKNDADYGKA